MNQFAPNLACLFIEIRRDFRKVRTLKYVLSLSPGEGGSHVL